MTKRIVSIDILRGLAVLQMIFWQIFDFFSRVDIYTSDSPYFVSMFNMPINGIGLALFAFASGASLYISVIGRLERKIRIRNIVFHSIKRYGGYIMLSLVFTTYVFGFEIFYVWKEAVQGIGFAALICAILILFCKSKWFFAILGVVFALVQPFLRALLENDFIAINYPLEPASLGLVSGLVSLLLNSTIRGFFSLTHTLPLLLFGVVLASILFGSGKKRVMGTSLFIGLIMIFSALIMHLSFNRIDVYMWSPSYQIGFIGFSFLLFVLIEYLLQRYGEGRIADFLSLFGKTAIIAYLFHFVVIYKPLSIFNAESLLGQPMSFLLTVISVAVIYYSCKVWLLNKKGFFLKIRKLFGMN